MSCLHFLFWFQPLVCIGLVWLIVFTEQPDQPGFGQRQGWYQILHRRRKPSVKWSKLRPKAQRIVDQCLACWDGKDVILSNPGRWDEPQMSEQTMYVFEKLIKQSESATAGVSGSGAHQSIHAADVWAAAMNAQLFRKHENLHQFLNTDGTIMKHQSQYIAFWIGSVATGTTTELVLRPSQNDRLSHTNPSGD